MDHKTGGAHDGIKSVKFVCVSVRAVRQSRVQEGPGDVGVVASSCGPPCAHGNHHSPHRRRRCHSRCPTHQTPGAWSRCSSLGGEGRVVKRTVTMPETSLCALHYYVVSQFLEHSQDTASSSHG